MLEDVQRIEQDAVKVAAADPWLLSDVGLVEVLRAARRVIQVLTVVAISVVQQAQERGLPAAGRHRGTAGWLREMLLLDYGEAQVLVSQATGLARQPRLRREVLGGRVSVRQAEVIARTVSAIPAGLADLDQVSLAETTRIAEAAQDAMVRMAAELPAGQLSRVGERILAHVAPHVAQEADAAALTRQEARAHAKRGFTLSRPQDGMVRLTGRLSAQDAAIVQAALHPLCTPARRTTSLLAPPTTPPADPPPTPPAGAPTTPPVGPPRTPASDPDDDRSAAQRRADALVEICRLALRTGELPLDGGEPPQVNVTVAYDTVTEQLGVGITDTGERVSPDVIRRMACDAKLLPVVLGGTGQILNLGRTRRLATGALRRALVIRDGGCAWPSCDRPARWADAHHIRPWASGGPTELDNCVLLCGHHHRLIHSDCGWTIRLGTDRRPDLIPPVHIDPQQLPRRNLYHQRQ